MPSLKFSTLILLISISHPSFQVEFSDLKDIIYIGKTKYPRENNYTLAITSPLETAFIYFRDEFKFKTSSPITEGLNYIDISSHGSDFFLTALAEDNSLLVSSKENREILVNFGVDKKKMTKILNLGIATYKEEGTEEIKDIHYAVGIDEKTSYLTKFSYDQESSYQSIHSAICLNFDGFKVKIEGEELTIGVLVYFTGLKRFWIRAFKYDNEFTQVEMDFEVGLLEKLAEVAQNGVKNMKVTFNSEKKRFSFIVIEEKNEEYPDNRRRI